MSGKRILVLGPLLLIAVVGCGEEKDAIEADSNQLFLNERVFRKDDAGGQAFAGGGCLMLTLDDGIVTGSTLESFSDSVAKDGAGLPGGEIIWGETITTSAVQVNVATSGGTPIMSRTYSSAFVAGGQLDSFSVTSERVFSFYYWGGACSHDLSVPAGG